MEWLVYCVLSIIEGYAAFLFDKKHHQERRRFYAMLAITWIMTFLFFYDALANLGGGMFFIVTSIASFIFALVCHAIDFTVRRLFFKKKN